MRALALYKERFLARLAPAARQAADFSRPAFMAAAFYLAARKVRVSPSLPCLFTESTPPSLPISRHLHGCFAARRLSGQQTPQRANSLARSEQEVQCGDNRRRS